MTVNAGGKEFLHDVRGDRLAAGRVLAVDDDHADPVDVDDPLELVLQDLAPGPPHDIADGENFYGVTH